MSAPAPPARRWWRVSVYYQTEGGNAGTWAGPIFAADEEEASRMGEKAARHNRPRLMKVDGGDVEPLPDNPA